MRALEAAAFAAGISEAALQEARRPRGRRRGGSLVLPGERWWSWLGMATTAAMERSWPRALAARGIGVELILAPRHAVTEPS